MPNPHGNPEFKSKYGEKTKVIRLPESIADALASLLSQGCASSDILEHLQPLSQQRLSNLADTDSTLVHLPVELRLLRAIKDVAKQEQTHYLQWILNQSKKGLDLSPNTFPVSPTFSQEQLNELIDKRLERLQAQLAIYESRLAHLENQPIFPHEPKEATTTTAITTAIAKPDPNQIKLPNGFPSKGLPSIDLAKVLQRHQKTINAHRRKGNGLLQGWEPKKVKGLAGWRYFPVTSEALKLWKTAVKRGLIKPTSAASD